MVTPVYGFYSHEDEDGTVIPVWFCLYPSRIKVEQRVERMARYVEEWVLR